MIIRRIARGLRESPEYGPHPGTPVMVGMIILGMAAGIDRGVWGATAGGCAMALIFGPLYLYGAWERGK